MATLSEIELRLAIVEQKVATSVTIPDYAKDVNDPSVAIGDTVMGIKAGINSGAFFIGDVLAAPPIGNSDITRYYP